VTAREMPHRAVAARAAQSTQESREQRVLQMSQRTGRVVLPSPSSTESRQWLPNSNRFAHQLNELSTSKWYVVCVLHTMISEECGS